MSNSTKSALATIGYLCTGSLAVAFTVGGLFPVGIILGYVTYVLVTYQNRLPEELPEGYYRDHNGIIRRNDE